MPMRSPMVRLTCALAAMTVASDASAQLQHLINDRDLDAVMRVEDVDATGAIEPGEAFVWFNGSNAARTQAPMNPTTLAVSVCRVASMGDQANRNVYRLVDLNQDGDAQDDKESIVFADAGNASGVSFAFPTGAAFDSQCRMHVANAGNGFGLDGIYRLVDLNGDGDAQDVVDGKPEVTEFVGQPLMGSVNSPSWGPQEILFDADDVCFMRNSVTGQHSVWRFEDKDGNGRADDPGESKLYFGAGNASSITVSAGFALDPDRFRTGSMYTIQIAAGGIDQLIRLTDLTNDDDAQDAGEAGIAWSEPASSISIIDIHSLSNGEVLLTEGGSGLVHVLRDLNGDSDFLDAGEMGLYHANINAALADVRQLDALGRAGDTNADGAVNVDDLLMVISNWGGSGCRPADLNCSGAVNVDDLLMVISNWG